MEKSGIKKGFQPLAEMISSIVDPILRRQAGLNIQLLENWPEIIGPDVAETTRPLKIVWSRRTAGNDTFEPATLVVACEGFSAIKLQHESSEIIQRINVFFGFCAIGRLNIEQKPVRSASQFAPQKGFINEEQKNQLERMTVEIRDNALRRSLFSLGAGILSDKNRAVCKKA